MTEIRDHHTAASEPEPQLDTTEARQAVAPHRLRYMLGFGIAGVVVAFAILYWLFVVA